MTTGSAGGSGTTGSSRRGGPAGSPPPPPAFRRAVAALRSAPPRPGMALRELRPPRGLAPFAHAVTGGVDGEDERPAAGRFVLLHDPDGQESWHGTFRVVILVRAELEAEMAADPLLPEVAWDWLTGALRGRAVAYAHPGGTVGRSTSTSFGGFADRPARAELEVRASWTAVVPESDEVPGVAAHLAAWGDLLRQCAGLPPEEGAGGPVPGASVVPLPQRRGPRPV